MTSVRTVEFTTEMVYNYYNLAWHIVQYYAESSVTVAVIYTASQKRDATLL